MLSSPNYRGSSRCGRTRHMARVSAHAFTNSLDKKSDADRARTPFEEGKFLGGGLESPPVLPKIIPVQTPVTRVGCGQKRHSVIIPPLEHIGCCRALQVHLKVGEGDLESHIPAGQGQGDPEPAAAQDHPGSPKGHQGVPEQCLCSTKITGRCSSST